MKCAGCRAIHCPSIWAPLQLGWGLHKNSRLQFAIAIGACAEADDVVRYEGDAL